MRFSIFFCFIIYTHSSCLSAHTNGDKCAKIQTAGQKIADNINGFDLLIQDVVMSCFVEAEQITKSALKYINDNMATTKSLTLTPIETDSKLQKILGLMGPQIDASFAAGHAKFFELLKKSGKMVVGDSIVTNRLVSLSRRKRGAHNIDDKILTLRQDMNTSLNGVERNLHGVASQLFNLLADSLKELSDDQIYKQDLDEVRKNLGKYLVEAVHSVIESHTEQFFQLLKDSALQIEMIDSQVTNIKNDASKLVKALEPAKTLIDEAIQNLKKSSGANEMKKQLKRKVEWMKQTFMKVKAKVHQG